MMNKNAKIISVVNQKGGVGKTTTTVNLATALAAVGKKILVVDLDPQGNASTGFGIDKDARLLTSYDLIIEGIDPREALHTTTIPNLSIIAADMDLSGAEIELVSLLKREFKLHDAIQKISPNYDYILIDCPPSLGLLTLNALTASGSVLIPLQTEFYAMEGLSHLLRTVELVKANLNPALEIEGIVLTMYDKRNHLSKEIEWEVRDYFGALVYDAVIPRNVRVSEAPSYGKPAIIYDTQCTGSRAYLKLASEVLKREKAPAPVAA